MTKKIKRRFRCSNLEIVDGVRYCKEKDYYCMKWCREYKKEMFK